MTSDTDVKFYADNSYISGKCVRANKSRKEIISGRAIDASTSRMLKFSNLETTDDDDNCNMDDKYLLKLVGGRRKDFWLKLHRFLNQNLTLHFLPRYFT